MKITFRTALILGLLVEATAIYLMAVADTQVNPQPVEGIGFAILFGGLLFVFALPGRALTVRKAVSLSAGLAFGASLILHGLGLTFFPLLVHGYAPWSGTHFMYMGRVFLLFLVPCVVCAAIVLGLRWGFGKDRQME